MTRRARRRPPTRIALIPGDGVGPEVVAGAVGGPRGRGRARSGSRFDWTELARRRRGDRHVRRRHPRPRTSRRAATPTPCCSARAAGPKWDNPDATVRPEQALFALRGGLGLFANLRPITVQPQLIAASPLKPELLEGVDCLIVRELTSGLYFGRPSEQRVTAGGPGRDRHPVVHGGRDPADRHAGVRAGARPAATRSPRSTRRTCSRRRACGARSPRRSTPDFPDVALDHRLVDSAAMQLVEAAGRASTCS